MKKTVMAVLSVCCALMIAAGGIACSRSQELPPNTLRIALQSQAKTLDPHLATDAASMRLCELLYSTLLEYTDQYGQWRPLLADSVHISTDNLSYTIFIKRGVVFHTSGSLVTANDVAYSLRRIQRMGVRSHHLGPVEAITAVDTYTVTLQLTEPFAPLLTHLAHPMNAIIDSSIEQPSREDAGSGPYQLVSWEPGSALIASSWKDCALGDAPAIDTLHFQIISDETTRMSMLKTGQIDLVTDVPAREVASMQRNKDFTTQSVEGTFWEYIGYNTRSFPFNDARVRRAVSHTLDRDAIAHLVTFSLAKPLHGGPLPSTHWAHDTTSIYAAPDTAQALQLLEQAGYGGEQVELIVGSSFPYQVSAAQVVKQQLAAVGMPVKIVPLESSVFFDRLNEGNFQMTLVGWVGFVDPDEWFYPLFHSQGSYNQQGFADSTLDALLESARRELDKKKRKRVYREISQLIVRQAPMSFLHINPQTSSWNQRLSDFAIHPTATLRPLLRARIEAGNPQ